MLVAGEEALTVAEMKNKLEVFMQEHDIADQASGSCVVEQTPLSSLREMMLLRPI